MDAKDAGVDFLLDGHRHSAIHSFFDVLEVKLRGQSVNGLIGEKRP